MDNLDRVNEMMKKDPGNVLGSIELFPDQLEDAWNEALHIQFPNPYKHVQNIVVCGMGGSRFTPKTIKELYADTIPVPYEIIDDYRIPGYVNEHTLVILSSYSGTTEEVVSCGYAALKKKALLTGIAQGGTVIDMLRQSKSPYYQFNPVNNPCGQPRVGSGYMLMGHLAILVKLELLKVRESEIVQSIQYVKKIGTSFKASIPVPHNSAKKLAIRLKDRYVFLIASEFLRGCVNGFANQINETAKMISDYRYIPEMNHHLMEGLKNPASLTDDALFVFIHSNLYSEKIQKRFTITRDVAQKQKIATEIIHLYGRTKISQVLEEFMLSGFTTYYLAMLYDIDPVAVPWVDYFKNQLAED